MNCSTLLVNESPDCSYLLCRVTILIGVEEIDSPETCIVLADDIPMVLGCLMWKVGHFQLLSIDFAHTICDPNSQDTDQELATLQHNVRQGKCDN